VVVNAPIPAREGSAAAISAIFRIDCSAARADAVVFPAWAAVSFHSAGVRIKPCRLDISLEEAYHGGQRALQLQSPERDASGQVTTRTRTLNVKIPAGVTNGQKIRLAGQGSAGMGGGPSGDLYLEVKIKPHPLYKVRERDITLELPLAPWEAALGGKSRCRLWADR
jgi:curved DNA-binding protein CbpA